MTRFLWTLLLVAVALGAPAQTETNRVTRAGLRRLLQDARERYHSAVDNPEEGLEAAKRFETAAAKAPEGELDPDALHLATGMSLLKAGKAEEALKALEAVEGFDTPRERGKLRRVRGNAHLALGRRAMEAKEWDEAETQTTNAVDAFTRALMETPDDEAARHNLELAHRRLKRIRELKPPPPPTPTPSPTPKPSPTPDSDEEKEQDRKEQPQPGATPTPKPGQSEDSEAKATPTPGPGEEQGEQQPDATPTPDDREGENQSSDAQNGEPDESGRAGTPEKNAEKELDAREARRILDAQLEQEERLRRLLLEQRARPVPVEKDW